MKNSPDNPMNPNHDNLEKLISKAVGGLPARKAPASLEQRVMAEIVRRQALPWWKKSWAYWPGGVRWMFLILSAALSAAVLAASIALFRDGSLSGAAATLSRPVQLVQQLWVAVSTLADLTKGLFGHIPSVWLYGTLAVVATLYASLFGIGAAAYRVLWQNR
jgi:hypothetical protein